MELLNNAIDLLNALITIDADNLGLAVLSVACVVTWWNI